MFRTGRTLDHAINRDEGEPGFWLQRHKALGCTAAGGTGQCWEVPSHKWFQHTPLRKGLTCPGVCYLLPPVLGREPGRMEPGEFGSTGFLPALPTGCSPAWFPGSTSDSHRHPQNRQKLSITHLTGRLVPRSALTTVKEWRKLPKPDRSCRSVFRSQRGISVFIN